MRDVDRPARHGHALTHRHAFLTACFLSGALVACNGSSRSVGDGPAVDTVTVHGWTPIADATDVAPIPITYQGKLYLFARQAQSGSVVVDTSADARSWHGWSSIPGAITDTAVAPVVFDNVLHVFLRSSIDNAIYGSFTTGDGWSTWSRVPNGFTDKSPSASAFGDKLYLFAKSLDNQVEWTSVSRDGGFTPWTSTGQSSDEAPAVASNSHMMLYAWVSGGLVRHAISRDGVDWKESPAPISSPESMTGVTAGSFGRDIYVTARGTATGHLFSRMTSGSPTAPISSAWFEIPPGSGVSDEAVGGAGFKDGFYWFAKGLDEDVVYENATLSYALPFDHGEGWSLASGNLDDPNAPHLTEYAFDFSHAEDGTYVRAMRDGQIVLWENEETCSFFDDWRCADAEHCCSQINQDCSFDGLPRIGNLVMVRHDDGTVASYNHLAYQSIPESVMACGATIHAGDIVGRLGHTGLVCGPPHVHVAVAQAPIDVSAGCVWGSRGYPDVAGIGLAGPSIPIYFHDRSHAAWRPLVGDTFAP